MPDKEYFQNRRIPAYLSLKYMKLAVAYAYEKSLSKSGSVTAMVKEKFDNMSEVERQKYLDIYNRLTPEEKKNPKV